MTNQIVVMTFLVLLAIGGAIMAYFLSKKKT